MAHESRLVGAPRTGSLARRLLAAAFVLVTVALVVAGIAIGFILHRFVRGQIDGRLDAQIVAIRSGLEQGPDGPRLARDFDAPPFDRAGSGWAWQVRRGGTRLRSASLGSDVLPVPAGPRPDDGSERPQPADATDANGRGLILRVLTLPAEDGGAPTVIAASAPAAALRGPLREALTTLALALAVLGLCLIGGVLAQVRLGLAPLQRLRADLAEVRAGRRERVPVAQPTEIRPLVAELNALLDQNAANLDRARTHVANLAHGLKTPLATLTLALADPARDADGTLSDLVGSMDRQVRHHLRRARAAALEGTARGRIDLASPVGDLAATLGRLHAAKGVRIQANLAEGLAVGCEAQDLDEMLGNLMDNACQWCRGEVRVSAAPAEGAVAIRVEDDGPGLDPAEAASVLRRGQRLDESVPGNGFGLSITLELAELYGGGLTLDRSGLGGLRATLVLPG
ncbi:sensor histidine kinase [Methylobacterium sp. WL30]|uniref:sensor histidine kinase n=3 Tax=Methylobacterium TaxID=407 RepID=UPI0011C83B7F|nr:MULTISPECIES: sensor histidine kinase [unclassified Methylobacterium]TXN50893.1 sensor histidine kinase [Methylobacterium sp. WL119]TXN68752.1 sensor histidine kinase [Methylobacterium sp. WL30]